MKIIIDRFEGEIAICETEEKEMININRANLPDGAAEGDIILFENDTIVIDNNAKEERRRQIEKLMDDLWE